MNQRAKWPGGWNSCRNTIFRSSIVQAYSTEMRMPSLAAHVNNVVRCKSKLRKCCPIQRHCNSLSSPKLVWGNPHKARREFGIPKQLHTDQGRNFDLSLIIQLPRKRLVVHSNHLKHEHLQDWVIHQRARQNTPNDNLTLREKDKSYKRDWNEHRRLHKGCRLKHNHPPHNRLLANPL